MPIIMVGQKKKSIIKVGQKMSLVNHGVNLSQALRWCKLMLSMIKMGQTKRRVVSK